jgi:hypothetical protein
MTGVHGKGGALARGEFPNSKRAYLGEGDRLQIRVSHDVN